MQKRTFIFLIIVIVVAVLAVLGFLYLRSGTTPGEVITDGTNFFSRLNPFGTTIPPAGETPPVDVSGYVPETLPPALKVKLRKVSSMPVAGFGSFMKERLKSLPLPDVPATPEQNEFGNQSNQSNKEEPLVAPAPIAPKDKKPIIDKKPVAPATEFALALRYVERETGNIYQTFADKIEERRFSTTIIPQVHEAHFGNKAQSVVMRYLQSDDTTIETFVGALPKEYLGADTNTTNEIKGYFLPENVADVSISPDGTRAFYLFGAGENMVGTILDLLTGKKTQVFESAFTEWLAWWSNAKLISLTTKASAFAPGHMYSLDSSTKNFTRTLGGISGLTTLTSPDAKLVLTSDSNLSLSLYQKDSKESINLGLRTLPEKCVWGKGSDVAYCAVPQTIESGLYPDSWYQGEISFTDQIWKIDTATLNTSFIEDPLQVVGGGEIDAIKLALDSDEEYLFFVNKKDSFLWELEL